MFSLTRLTKNEHLGTWLEGCYILPMQLTYNGSIPLVHSPVVKLQAHFHVKYTQPPHHSHLGLEFTKCTPNHFLHPLKLISINLKMYIVLSWTFLQFGLPSNITKTNKYNFSVGFSNVCVVYHAFKQFWSQFSDNRRPNQKKYVFKFMQISTDRVLIYWLLFQTCKFTFFSWQVSKRVS